jgi:hypothetical protein
VIETQKASTRKIFPPDHKYAPRFELEEIEFLRNLCLEDERRTKKEQRQVSKQLGDAREKLTIMEKKGRTEAGVTWVPNYMRIFDRVVLEHDYETYRKLEGDLTVRNYGLLQRLTVIRGFVKRFNLILDGRRTRGGRLNFLSCEARRVLYDPTAMDLMFDRSTLEEEKHNG